jgi:hypothetical protein
VIRRRFLAALRGLLPAVACGCLLFAVFTWHRSHLVPRDADFQRAQWQLTGDEPDYLLLAQAIAAGDGQNVRPSIERGSYLSFQSRPIIGPSQWTWETYRGLGFNPLIDRSKSWENQQVLPRLPLFSTVVAPLVGRTTRLRWLVAFLQALLVTGTAAMFVACAAEATLKARVHTAAALLFVLGSLPVAYYTTQMFPETLGGALLLCAFFWYSRGDRAAGLVGNALLVLSLWSTPRVAGGVLAATAVLAVQNWRERRYLNLGALVLGWLIFLLSNLWVWGSWMIPNQNPYSRNSPAVFPEGILRFFLGSDVGLLFLSPVTWVCLIAAAVNLYLLRKPIDLAWAALFTGILAVVATFPDFRAGTCPAGRYQVIPAYLLAFPMIRLLLSDLGNWRQRLTPVMYLLGIAGLAISLVVATRPTFWYRPYYPLLGFGEIQRFGALLPPAQGPARIWLSLAWLGGFSLLLLLFRPKKDARDKTPV